MDRVVQGAVDDVLKVAYAVLSRQSLAHLDSSSMESVPEANLRVLVFA